jgi:ribonucleoside-diphosphate reductase beta chain
MQLIKPKLFNPTGDDSLQARELLNGNCTNIINLNNVKYKAYYNLYKKQLEQFWIPEKVDLTNDKVAELTDDEYTAYKGILSFLTFLDSIQTNNLPNIADWFTAPEVKMCLSAQQFFESVHTAGYQYIFESTISSIEERNTFYDYWRDDPILLERNTYIAQIYQDFLYNESQNNFDKVMIADYLLEGLFFYQGFLYFYNLASRKKMTGVSSVIRYINKDELLHVGIFANLIRDLQINLKSDLIYEMFDIAVYQEIKWNQHILKNILGITDESIEQYTKFLANKRLSQIGLNSLYENVTNPYRHLEKIAGIEDDNDALKSNFFESTVTAYNMASAIEGWDEI